MVFQKCQKHLAQCVVCVEIYLLEIVNEVYFRMKYDYDRLRKSAEERLDKKIKAMNNVEIMSCP